jgi:hypothetical protein
MSDNIEVPEYEVPDAIVRTRAGGVAWREMDTPLQKIELIFHEMDELDPDRGRERQRRNIAFEALSQYGRPHPKKHRPSFGPKQRPSVLASSARTERRVA